MFRTRAIALTIGLCTLTGGALRAETRPSVTVLMSGTSAGGSLLVEWGAMGGGYGVADGTIFNGSMASGDAKSARDSMIPALGTSGFESDMYVEINRVTVRGTPGFRVRNVSQDITTKEPSANFYGSHLQPYVLVSSDGGSTRNVLEPGRPIQVGGLMLEATTCEECSSAAPGGVPAVSTWGVAIMGLLVLTAGTVAILRRRTSLASSV